FANSYDKLDRNNKNYFEDDGEYEELFKEAVGETWFEYIGQSNNYSSRDNIRLNLLSSYYNKIKSPTPWTPITPSKTDVKVKKAWEDKDGKEIAAPVEEIEVELYKDGNATGEKKKLNKANNWKAEFKDLDVVEKTDSEKAYEYTVKEVGEKDGSITIGDSKYKVSYNGSMEEGFKVTNKLEEKSSPWTPITPSKTDVKVKKAWEDKDGKEIAAPVEKIEVELYKDGKATGKNLELNKANKWSGEFKDLDVLEKVDSEKAYEYTVKEVGEEKGKVVIGNNKYEVKYSGSMKDGFTITNEEEPTIPPTPLDPPKEDIKVEKIWQDKGGKEISAPVDKIEVELYRDGKSTGKKLELNKANNWSGEFKDLDVVEKLDSEKAYEYSVKEVGEEKGKVAIGNNKYEVKYSGSMKDGFTITNEEEPTIPPTPLDPPKEDIKVEKIWQDKDGKEISAPVDKIEVELYRDEKSTGKKLELNKANNWSGEFKDLDVVEKLDSEKAYEYSVKEVGEEKGKVVIGNNKYEVKYSGSMKDGFTITNEEEPTIPPTPLDPPKEDIKVEKIWQDKDGKEISAPVDKIEVELYRDGKSTGKKLELNKANNWSGEFKDLDVVEKVDSKEAFKYSVKEVGEETGSIKLNGHWYKVNYSGSMKDGFTVTNKEEPKTPPTPPTPSEPDTITIKVKKDWTLYGNKPVDKIVVELYRDGKATGKILELNKDNNWSGEFKNLDVKKGANSTHDYHYTIKEIGESGNTIKLDGRWFDVNYLGNMKDGFTIVNKEEKPKEPGKPEEPSTPNKPNDPQEPNKPNHPQEPNKPETPKEPEKPNNPGTPVKPNIPKTPLPGKPLPKTGNGLNPSTYAWILLGLGNLSTFAGIQRKKRIKSRRKKNVK
ncbi:Cna B-type domain-containing protein, partial [Aedoeadaptatus acetigenes]|uniref:Cna B-type domain-containing protein n=1 Tax=Aedoeadaptatus acetigenes TaxID=2981723 RepID=UPI0011DDDE6D